MNDALTHLLESVRMEGSVFSRAELSAPWGVESGQLPWGVFHAVVDGSAWARLSTETAPVQLHRGDIVMFPFGDNHFITDAPDSPTRSIGLLTSVDERGMGHLVVDGGGTATSLICGKIAFEQAAAHPVLSLLPPLVVVRDSHRQISNVAETLVELIAREIDSPVAGSATVVARLTDALIVYVLRAYIDGLPDEHAGRLRALRDRHLSEALALMHTSPEQPWTAQTLASAAGLSRSVFFSRFKAMVGETPAEYLTSWRIHLATRMLREGRSVAETARCVGYATEAAFSNAFVRVMGIRPGAYRRSA